MKKNVGKNIFGKIKKHKILCLFMAVAIVGCFIAYRWIGKPFKKEENNQKGIQTTVLKKRDLSSSVSVTGTIASADKREVTTNLNEIEIEEISVGVGDYVEAGDTIVIFDKSDLEDVLETTQDDYELNSLKQNQSLKQAKDNVEESQSNYENGVKEQESIVSEALSQYNTACQKESDALSTYEEAKSATEKAKAAYEKLKENKSSLKKTMTNAEKENKEAQKKLSEAKLAYDSAEANIKYTSETDENYELLNQIYIDAYQTYINAQKDAEQKEAAYNKAKNDYDAIEIAKKAYEEAEKAEETAKNNYEEASKDAENKSSSYQKAVNTQSDTNTKNAKNIEESKNNLTITSKEVSNNLKSQGKQVQEAEEKLGKCIVTSPISGYITAINAEAGDIYNGQDTLFIVQDTTKFVVDATVDEYDIASLKKNQEAVIKTDATGDEELKGVLTYVALTPDENNNSMGSSSSDSNYTIQITLTDTHENLRIGMTAKTSIILESAKDVYAVAYDCIETDENGNSYITVLEENKTISSRDNADATRKISVEVGMESDYYVEINSDELKEGIRIVTPETVDNFSEGNNRDFEMVGFPNGGMQNGEAPDRSTRIGGGNRGSGNMPGGF